MERSGISFFRACPDFSGSYFRLSPLSCHCELARQSHNHQGYRLYPGYRAIGTEAREGLEALSELFLHNAMAQKSECGKPDPCGHAQRNLIIRLAGNAEFSIGDRNDICRIGMVVELAFEGASYDYRFETAARHSASGPTGNGHGTS